MLLGRQSPRKATFSRARSPCNWLGSADIAVHAIVKSLIKLLLLDYIAMLLMYLLHAYCHAHSIAWF